jgi:hypothetical protein
VNGFSIQLPALGLSPTVQALVVLAQQGFGGRKFRETSVEMGRDMMEKFVPYSIGILRLGDS